MAHLAAEMGLLQGSVFCPAVHCKHAGASKVLPYTAVLKASKVNGNGIMGRKVIDSVKKASCSQGQKNAVRCSLYSSSNESNSMAGNFKEDDTCYVNAIVVEAVEVKNSSDGFMVMMKDGEHLRCVHNNPQSRHQPEHDWQPAIILKMEDGSDLFLPILASAEIPSMQLMAATGDVRIARRSMYQVVQEMTEKMGYAVKMVRVTDRVCGSYFAQLHLTKKDDKSEGVTIDLQPSDAINIAMRCKAPIQVNRYLACSDGLRVTETAKPVIQRDSSKELFSAELDRPTDEKCVDAKEFILLRNMLLAAVEERYIDAAQWRDQLNRLRSTWMWMFV